MAPPNNSSFSVSVVLPASGCEMMAKLRRRPISRSNMDTELLEKKRAILPDARRQAAALQGQIQDQRVFAAVIAGVIVLAQPDLLETTRVVQAQCRLVGRPHFQQHLVSTAFARQLDEMLEQQPPVTLALPFRGHADVEQVRLA